MSITLTMEERDAIWLKQHLRDLARSLSEDFESLDEEYLESLSSTLDTLERLLKDGYWMQFS